MKHWLITATMLLGSVAMCAETVEIDGIWYNLVFKAKQAEVVKSGDTKYSGSITIPATVIYEGVEYSVTSIGDDAFYYCIELTSITISEGVMSIGSSAFRDCWSLTTIILPESVTDIGSSAFDGCPSLTAVHISNIEAWCKISFANYGSNPLYIAHDLYLNGELVTNLVIPESVTSIGNYAFLGCSSLTAITIPEGVTSIGNYAFENCSSLTSITIPKGVTSIGVSAFEDCYSLTSITIPEGVTSIGSEAFRDCSLTSITIPESVTSIGVSAFEDCETLTAVYISNIEAWCKISFGSFTSNPLYHAPNFYIDGELVTDLVVPEGVTSIGGYAFYRCSSLTSITIPDGVTGIGDCAFENCINLNSVVLPPTIETIEGRAFYKCSSLTSISILESVKSLGYGAFYGCSSLTSIILRKGLTSIGRCAFQGCTGIASITIPEGVTSIGECTFEDCSSLTSITIPESVTSIRDHAFYGCVSLTTIVLPKSVEAVYSEAFANCHELNDVYCNADKVPSTKADAFDGSYIEYATLHVPSVSIEAYKMANPWSSFGKIAGITKENITSITLNQTVADLTEGDELKLAVVISPNYATDKTITWTTSAESVATVDNTGKVNAIAPGTATITATANDGSGISASCEVQVKARETSVVIDDPYVGDSFVLRENVENVGITYTRNYTGNWEALYIPFEITVDEAFLSSFEVAYINDVRSYDNDNNGEVDDMVMEAFKITSGTLRTSYPYLIRAKNAGEATITVTDATLYATTAENMHSVNCSSVYMEYTVSGTYTTMTADQLDGCYAMSKGGAWIEASSPSATLRPFRLYLSMESRDDSYLKVNPTALKAIRLKVDGEETTAIEHSEFRIQNSELIYDLQGRRVENPGKGVYIVNGKKVIYK